MAPIVSNPVTESPTKSEALDLMKSDSPEKSARGGEVPASVSSSCKKSRVEDSDVSSIDDQDELLPRPVRKKRPNRRYAEWSSEDEYCLRAFKRSYPKYKEASSSESESDFTRPSRDTALKPTGLPIGVVRGCPKCSECQVVLARWRPEEGRKPFVPEAPVFYPTAEEFKDTLAYIAKIRSAAEPFGICRVVPPREWQPPCPLREDSAKLQVLKFPTRVQEIHKLQVRQPVKKCSQAKQRLGGRRGRGGFRGRMGRPCRRTPNPSATGGPTKSVQADESFGFEPGSYFSIGMFEKYAQQFMDQYFFTAKPGDKLEGVPESKGDSASVMNPSVDAIEGEYWRVVEKPTEQIEVLYGADVETGNFASGFPKTKAGDGILDPNSYEKSGWNLNNIARLPGSMLAFEEGDISGVLVPWLYIGMCFSSFCWHVEDHHFYSLNYLHWGAPKVWYGVAGHAAHGMEEVMKKHLPDLFDEQPDLLHKLVTQLSPSILKGEGLPVYRLVQQAGEFVITFPRAYHSGFNCGFNCAEAVNLAPADWLPHGQSAVELYREQRRKTSVSHDKLLIAAAREAVNLLLQSQNEPSVDKFQGQIVKQEVLEQCEKIGAYGGSTEFPYAWQAFCGQGGVLAKALKTRVDLERFRQTSLTGEVHMKKMDRCYDATDERECAECHYDLHLSAVGCECCPEKYVCLAHAHLLCACQWGRKSVMYRYDLVQLELLVAALEGQPGALTNWFEHEQCSSSASSVSTLSSFPQPSRQDSVVRNLGPCEFNSTAFTFDKAGFKVQDLESENLYTKPRIRPEVGGNALSHQWLRGSYTEPAVPPLSSGIFVNNFVQLQSVPQTSASVVEARKTTTSGFQTKGQLGIPCGGKWPQNGFVKIEKQVAETSPLIAKQEVIVLSDDEEERALSTKNVEFPSINSHVGSHSSNCTTPIVDTARNDTMSKRSEISGEAVIGHSGASLGSQPLVPVLLSGALPGVRHTFGNVVPQFSSSTLITPSAHVPSITPAPPTVAHTQVVQVGSLEVLSSFPSRARSIGNLKQQARAGSAQNLASTLRRVNSRADYLQRVQSDQDVSGAELCGHLPTPDTQRIPSVQIGVQARRLPAGPRVAKVVRKKVYCEVELLNVGSLILREGWHDKHSIYPAGFRSRTSFCNVRNISQSCFYISEIVECGQTGPRFKVSVEGNSMTAFVDDSIDVCWQAVQEQINAEIIRRRGVGETNLPPLHPPQSLRGLDLFGLTSGAIIQAVEAVDPQHHCLEYWAEKVRNTPPPPCHPPAHTSDHSPSTLEDFNILRPKVSGGNVEVTSRPPTPTTETPVAKGAAEDHLARAGLYDTLKRFFHKGRSDELQALHRLFSCEWQSKEWREGFQALTDVLETQD